MEWKLWRDMETVSGLLCKEKSYPLFAVFNPRFCLISVGFAVSVTAPTSSQHIQCSN